MRRNSIHIWVWILIVGLVSFSCSSNKPVVYSVTHQNGLQGAQKVAFDETYFSGLSAKHAGDSKGAAAYFQQCLTLDKDNVAVKYELSQAYVKMNFSENAVKFAEEVYQAEPDNHWYAENLAQVYLFAQKYPQAAAIFEVLLADNPNEISYYYELGSAYLYSNNATEAIKTYEGLENKVGFENALAEQLYKLYVHEKMYTKAEAKVIQLMTENPNEVRYMQMLAKYYNEQGETEKSIALYEKLKEERPNDPFVKLALYEYYYELGDTAIAFQNLEDAFSSSSVDISSKMSILLTFLKRSEGNEQIQKETLKLLEIMVVQYPEDAAVWAINGDFLNTVGEKEKSRKMFLKSLSIDENNYEVWNQVLFIDSELNDSKSLLLHSQQCIALFPNQVLPHYFSGVVYMQEEEYQKSIDAFVTAKELAYGIRELEIQIAGNLGDAYYQIGNYQKSWISYDEALRMNPSNDYVLNNYAYFLSVQNEQLEKALEMSKQTVERSPQNAIYLDTYGWIFYQMGNYSEAVKYLALAVKNDASNSGEIFEHLGDALFQLGKIDDALINWKAAKSYGGASDALDAKIKNRKL